MNKQYSAEFKLEAVKRIGKAGEPVSNVTAELRVKQPTMQGWIKKYKQFPQSTFPDSGHLSPEDKKLEMENRELKEVVTTHSIKCLKVIDLRKILYY